MTIGQRIYKLRSSLNLSQKEFADKLGVSQSSVNYWENGNREPKINQLKKLSERFNVPLHSLLDFPLPSNMTIWENDEGEKMISAPINPDDLSMALNMDEGMRVIYTNYNKLNDIGKGKAVERLNELTEIERYTKDVNLLTKDDFTTPDE